MTGSFLGRDSASAAPPNGGTQALPETWRKTAVAGLLVFLVAKLALLYLLGFNSLVLRRFKWNRRGFRAGRRSGRSW